MKRILGRSRERRVVFLRGRGDTWNSKWSGQSGKKLGRGRIKQDGSQGSGIRSRARIKWGLWSDLGGRGGKGGQEKNKGKEEKGGISHGQEERVRGAMFQKGKILGNGG